MTLTSTTAEERCRLGSELWLALYGAITLAQVRDHGQAATAALEAELFRRHQARHFRPGLEKLGLLDEPSDAVRCAKYHYLSNHLGGLDMEYAEETPGKVWVRYRAPAWTFDGPDRPAGGLAAIAPEVGEAPMRGWHANNGRVLGNPRLRFVMTQVQAAGDPWDAGYFEEADTDLAEGETFVRRPGEWGPPFDPARAPKLDPAVWPAARQAGARRNYAFEFTANKIGLLVEHLGTAAAVPVVRHGFAVTLVQRYRWLADHLAVTDPATAPGAAELIAATARLAGDEVTVTATGAASARLEFTRSRLHDAWPGLGGAVDGAIADAWSAALPLFRLGLGVRCEGNTWDVSG